ncbi:murein L,D-transpeptidase [Stappia sp. F7233]|uniref:Murein L,D-transpeptidase n=1 Tax=Stappia albiluteola TaxID=2758565 RepID=A0A839AH15_9HYPH|nr:murein L,D-transpeptidase family protein [Stappia albiluteola]MBA5778981.1 murein L,D-transpeptidase [Stappia albiluteola]
MAVHQSLKTRWLKLGMAVALGFTLAACQADEFVSSGPKHLRPVSASIKEKMQELGMKAESPIMIRIYKEDSELEVWKQTKSGRYALLKSFEICKWSGELGPKIKEGDRQAPEGFYEITPALMNPNSSYHLAFNMGYPNKFDRAYGRTGSHLMVHGACSSRGCYAMTDEQIQDIYALARDSFRGGQRSFQVQALPFRMTPENMVKHRDSEHFEFWKMLKRGTDHFEVTKVPPQIGVCEKRYVFDATQVVEGVPLNAVGKCPDLDVPDAVEQAVAAKERKDEEKFNQIVASIERSEERKKQFAAIFGSDEETAQKTEGDAATAPVTVAAAPAANPAGEPAKVTAPASASEAIAAIATNSDQRGGKPEAERLGVPTATAFAPEAKKPSDEGGFFTRFIPTFGLIGGDDEERSAPDPALAAAPAPQSKPDAKP